MRNPAVAGNILRVLVFCRLTLGSKLMTQEESHPDQEGHADNRRRRQSGQVTEQGTLLSGRPASLPSRTAVTSQPVFIGVTADEHWVISRGPTYALLLIPNGRPAAPSLLRAQATPDGLKPGPGPRPGTAGAAQCMDRQGNEQARTGARLRHRPARGRRRRLRRQPARPGLADRGDGREGQISTLTTEPGRRLARTAPRSTCRRDRIPDVAGESAGGSSDPACCVRPGHEAWAWPGIGGRSWPPGPGPAGWPRNPEPGPPGRAAG